MRLSTLLLPLFIAAAALTCGGGSDAPKCVPGQSNVCAGVGGCPGFQLCLNDGTFAACDCGNVSPDGGAGDSGNPDVVAPNDTGASDVGADVGPFSVKNLPGLAVWFDASVGVIPDPAISGGVKRWLDQSGNGNDATALCLNLCPQAPKIDPAVLNAKDAMAMDLGTGFTIDDAPTLQWGTGDWGIVMVVRPSNNAGGERLWNKDMLAGVDLEESGATYSVRAGGSAFATTTSPLPTKFQLLAARGKALELRVASSTSTGPTTSADVSSPGVKVNLLWHQSTESGYEVAEVIAVKGTLSDSDLGKVSAYLKAKYNLP